MPSFQSPATSVEAPTTTLHYSPEESFKHIHPAHFSRHLYQRWMMSQGQRGLGEVSVDAECSLGSPSPHPAVQICRQASQSPQCFGEASTSRRHSRNICPARCRLRRPLISTATPRIGRPVRLCLACQAAYSRSGLSPIGMLLISRPCSVLDGTRLFSPCLSTPQMCSKSNFHPYAVQCVEMDDTRLIGLSARPETHGSRIYS